MPKQKQPDQLPWFKCHQDLWLEGTRDLTPEQRGIYFDSLCLMYKYNAPLRHDDKWVAFELHVPLRVWRRVKASLIACGKLIETPQGIANERASKEITARGSDRSFAEHWADHSPNIGPQLKKSSKKINEPAATDIRREKKEDRKKETTTPEAAQVVEATFADEVLTTELQARFYSVATKFGVKAGAITFPPSREESDALLRELVAISLADADDLTMARTAFANALTALQASDMTARASGWEGRYHGGGIPAAIKYLSKCLPDKLADVRLAQAVARAKAITEEAVQKKIAEKRLNGVGQGRQSAQSWEEAAATLQ